MQILRLLNYEKCCFGSARKKCFLPSEVVLIWRQSEMEVPLYQYPSPPWLYMHHGGGNIFYIIYILTSTHSRAHCHGSAGSGHSGRSDADADPEGADSWGRISFHGGREGLG